MSNIMKTDNITAVLVYLDRRKTRSYVGKLTSTTENNKTMFQFEYDSQYLKRKYAIPLGPELSLAETIYKSESLFASFQDRIPSRANPAYPDYCREAGISQEEKNPIVLLSSIGKRGPSSFVFEPEFKENFSANDLKKYRKNLDLNIREFSALFGISASHLQRVESGQFPGKDILKLIEIYEKYPSVAIDEIKKNSKAIHSDKYIKILDLLQEPPSNELGPWSDILLRDEVEYTMSLIKKLKKEAWSNALLNNKEIKKAIEAVKSYNLFVKKVDKKPEMHELDPEKMPMLMKTSTGETWVYGKNPIGEPQLKQLDEREYDIEFKDTSYKVLIDLLHKPEIYFILNGKYHNHFHKNQVINIKSRFFEIRFAYAIYASGLKTEYEFKTGNRKKSVDFNISGKKTKNNFLVELTSLRDSEVVKEKTHLHKTPYGNINVFSETSSNLYNLSGENPAEERTDIKIQKALLEKAEKFPKPEDSPKCFHIIIVDIRGFLAGASDKNDYKHIVSGAQHLPDVDKRYFKSGGKRELIKGVFEKSYEDGEVREKIHAIGFISEKDYTPNEIKSKTCLFVNPTLVNKEEENILTKLFEGW